MPLNAGTKLGPYEIRSLIGAGGMGEVYKASDSRLNRMVAIKVLGEGVIHRDLEPANIMLTASGPKLLDFGLAKLRSREGNGVLALRETPRSLGGDQLIWFDRTGTQMTVIGKPGGYFDHALSPNGKQLAVAVDDQRGLDLWVTDLIRGIPSRLTSEPTSERSPVWSPAGDTIVFSSNRGKGTMQLYAKAATGLGEERLMLASDQTAYYSYE